MVLVHQEALVHLDSKAHLDHRGHRVPQVTRDPRERQVHLALMATTEQVVPLELQVMPVPLELMAKRETQRECIVVINHPDCAYAVMSTLPNQPVVNDKILLSNGPYSSKWPPRTCGEGGSAAAEESLGEPGPQGIPGPSGPRVRRYCLFILLLRERLRGNVS